MKLVENITIPNEDLKEKAQNIMNSKDELLERLKQSKEDYINNYYQSNEQLDPLNFISFEDLDTIQTLNREQEFQKTQIYFEESNFNHLFTRKIISPEKVIANKVRTLEDEIESLDTLC